jgi:hypothetical protein
MVLTTEKDITLLSSCIINAQNLTNLCSNDVIISRFTHDFIAHAITTYWRTYSQQEIDIVEERDGKESTQTRHFLSLPQGIILNL